MVREQGELRIRLTLKVPETLGEFSGKVIILADVDEEDAQARIHFSGVISRTK
jgi:carbon monoxide dehydrogenase subunit G